MHPNSECLPYNIFFWHLPPNSTIATIITVITHHKIVSSLNGSNKITAVNTLIMVDQVINITQLLT